MKKRSELQQIDALIQNYGDGQAAASGEGDINLRNAMYANLEKQRRSIVRRIARLVREARSSSSPSVPTAIQEQRDTDKRACPQYIEAHGYCTLSAGHDGDCTLEREEAANGDTERLDFYSRRPHAVFWNVSQFDGDSGWREAVHDPARRHKSLREAIDAAKLAARVQGENGQ